VALKKNHKSDVHELIGNMALLSELVIDLQASSARGAAQMALSSCLVWASTLNIDQAIASIPEGSDPDKLLDACS
jgi:hypothetical protein